MKDVGRTASVEVSRVMKDSALAPSVELEGGLHGFRRTIHGEIMALIEEKSRLGVSQKGLLAVGVGRPVIDVRQISDIVGRKIPVSEREVAGLVINDVVIGKRKCAVVRRSEYASSGIR